MEKLNFQRSNLDLTFVVKVIFHRNYTCQGIVKRFGSEEDLCFKNTEELMEIINNQTLCFKENENK
ncbi:MAG: hypothetical protein WBO70_00615 [Erysipelotrichaceae bacterium]